MNANSFFPRRWCSLAAPVMIGLLLAGSGCSSEQTPSQDAQSTRSTGETADVATAVPAQIPSAPAPAADAARRGDVAAPPLSKEDQILLKQLSDPSPGVREDAVDEMEASGAVLEPLARIITTDPSSDVRVAAIYSLKESDDPGAVDVLIQGLDQEDPEILMEVIDGLWFIGDRRALPHLTRMLDHPNEDVRDTAKFALENFN